MIEVMERITRELDELLANLGKANCLLSNSLIRQVLIETILEIPEILIKDPDQTLDSFLKIVGKRYPEFLDIIIKDNWMKVLLKEEK